MRRLLAPAVLAVVAAVVVAILPTGPADAAATLTLSVFGNGDVGDPEQVSVDDLFVTPVHFTIGTGGSSATNVAVSAVGDGLRVYDNLNPSYASVGPEGVSGDVTVAGAKTPGFHSLTVTVTADGVAPVSATIDRLWAAGGPQVASTGSLANQVLAYQGVVRGENLGAGYRQDSLLWFLDDHTAYVGEPPSGRPRCGRHVSFAPVTGCVAYAYDSATGLVEIGRNIGMVRPDGIHLSGEANELSSDSEGLHLARYDQRLSPPRAGSRYDVRLRFADRHSHTGVKKARLSMRGDGTFELRVDHDAVRRGRYTLKKDGLLVLRSAGRTTRHTFLAVVGAGRKPKPQRDGAWMTFKASYYRVPDVDTLGVPLTVSRR